VKFHTKDTKEGPVLFWSTRYANFCRYRQKIHRS